MNPNKKEKWSGSFVKEVPDIMNAGRKPSNYGPRKMFNYPEARTGPVKFQSCLSDEERFVHLLSQLFTDFHPNFINNSFRDNSKHFIKTIDYLLQCREYKTQCEKKINENWKTDVPQQSNVYSENGNDMNNFMNKNDSNYQHPLYSSNFIPNFNLPNIFKGNVPSYLDSYCFQNSSFISGDMLPNYCGPNLQSADNYQLQNLDTAGSSNAQQLFYNNGELPNGMLVNDSGPSDLDYLMEIVSEERRNELQL